MANAGAAVIRFAILRTWVFRPEFGTHLAAAPGTRRAPAPDPAPIRSAEDAVVTDTNLGDDTDGLGRRRATDRSTTLRSDRPPASAPVPAPYRLGRPTTPTVEPCAGASRWTAPPAEPPTPAPPPGGWSRLVRGRPEDPAWVRPALVALLVGTGFLYIWGLGQSGWANSFYSAAVQAGTKSWKAFFFGSFDSSNFITVDKPPASLWVMEISARMFGVNSWSILVPQALEGVATVGLLFVTVRRWFSPGAALLAGAVLALTPVATLMFRFNNPDALLTLVLTAAAYATVRAVEGGRTRWMVLAGALIGFGFITKMLQALILLPVLALVYLLAGPPEARPPHRPAGLHRRWPWWCRPDGGWRPSQLTPAADRPYIGGSTNNSELNLIFGYNGFGRLTGNETGSVGGHGHGRQHVGPDRLEPAVPLVDGRPDLVADPRGADRPGGRPVADPARPADRPDPGRLPPLRRLAAGHRGRVQLRPRHHPPLLHRGPGPGRRRPGRHGRVHPVAPPPADLPPAGPGRRHRWPPSPGPSSSSAGAPPGTRRCAGSILVVGVVAALGIALVPRARGVLAAGMAGFGIASIIAAPAAYSLDTAATPHSGAIPSAGPAVQSGGGFGGPGGFGGAGGFGGGGFGGFARNGITLPKGFTLPNGDQTAQRAHHPAELLPAPVRRRLRRRRAPVRRLGGRWRLRRVRRRLGGGRRLRRRRGGGGGGGGRRPAQRGRRPASS